MTYDQSLDGSSNGSGGRFNDSLQQIIDKQQREQAAITKAAENPASLTAEDLADLPGDLAAKVLASGQAAHLGFGRPRRGRRH